MKLEINEDEQIYRLVDGEDGTDSYVTGDTASFGEAATLELDGEDSFWTAYIDIDGECTGLATHGSKIEPIGFELGCEWDEEDDEDEDDDEEDTKG